MKDDDRPDGDPLMKHFWYRSLVWLIEKSKIFSFLFGLFLWLVHRIICLVARIFVRPGKRGNFYEYYDGPGK
jgi:hypothetical protein